MSSSLFEGKQFMAAFEYTALEKTGQTCKGVLEGDAPRQIRQQLREQGLIPLSVEEVVRPATQRRYDQRRIQVHDFSLLTRQFATLIRSGLGIEEALKALSEQTDKAYLKSMLLAIRARILEGHSLAEGLSHFPGVFSELYRATVAAGEHSGHLDIVLERLADYTENRQQLRQKTLLALFYPILLTGVAVLVVGGLLTYVVPQVIQVFNSLHQELPWLTRMLIALSHFLQTWGLVIVLLIITMAVGLRYTLRWESVRCFIHQWLLKIPLLARIERGTHVARFTRTLSILTASGVPLVEGLQITTQVVSNCMMRKAIQEATNKVREGSSLHHALKVSHLFPPMIIYLIASGETGGHLDEMLERASVMQERELETLLSILLSLFEPLLILLMGGIVLTIVLAILMPIFELNQLIK